MAKKFKLEQLFKTPKKRKHRCLMCGQVVPAKLPRSATSRRSPQPRPSHR